MRVLYSSLAVALAMEDSLLDETVLIQLKTQQKVQTKRASVTPQLLRAKKMKLQALAHKKQYPSMAGAMEFQPMPAPPTTEYWDQPMEECTPGCPLEWIGDGICDYACDACPECEHDQGDCQTPPFETWEAPEECNAGCPLNWIGDGICDHACAECPECEYDMGDCDGPTEPEMAGTEYWDAPEECTPGCPVVWIGDGICDHACEECPECEHDHGDCDFEEGPYHGPDGTDYNYDEAEEHIDEWVYDAVDEIFPGEDFGELKEEFDNMSDDEQFAVMKALENTEAYGNHFDDLPKPEDYTDPAEFVEAVGEEVHHHEEHYYEAEMAAYPDMDAPAGFPEMGTAGYP